MRYKIEIEYDGTAYSGWQTQPNANTIQDEIEKALQIILKSPVKITGSGRTDAGVHARGQVAHFDFHDQIDTKRTLQSLFGLLPRDIAVYSLTPVESSFHSRFDAKERVYHYYFSNEPVPLFSHCTTYWWHEFDIERMNQAASFLKGDTDCISFTPADDEQPHLRCIFYDAQIIKGADREPHCFQIRANRFLRSVVRSLMGTLIEVGRGTMSVEMYEQLIKNPDRTKAGPTAPAKGLVLHKVVY